MKEKLVVKEIFENSVDFKIIIVDLMIEKEKRDFNETNEKITKQKGIEK